jgi:transcription-repair coupling factor (superfamily II helicase)
MRDLEIRGAGNMLGPEQSGQITAVGFELYCQLLKQSIASLKGEKVKPRVDVQVRFDFLALSPGEETPGPAPRRSSSDRSPASGLEITVGREVATFLSVPESPAGKPPEQVAKASAFIPLAYISEAQQRIDVYRKLAQATDKPALDKLQTELRDRFGPLPPAVDLLLLVAELKVLASERSISVLEVKDGKLMLTRNNDYLTLSGKFPRLTKKDAGARLKEIRRLLLAL